MTTNNFIYVTPHILHVKELVPFDQTFLIGFDADSADYYFENVEDISDYFPITFNYHDILIDPKYNIKHVRIGGTGFALSGTITNAFERQITYMNADYTTGVVSSLTDLPSTYASLTGYTAPAGQVVIDCTIRLRNKAAFNTYDLYPFKIVVDNNHDLFNEQFAAAVKNGVWSKGVSP